MTRWNDLGISVTPMR